MKEYIEAAKQVYDVLDAVRKDPVFSEIEEVKIRVVMVQSETPPALTQGGYPAAALIKRVASKDLCLVDYHAVIYVDVAQYLIQSAEWREALFAHQLCHLAVDDPDVEEPKVSLRPHDFVVGGFYHVLRQYGENAIEYQEMKAAHAQAARDAAEGEQMLWDWGIAQKKVKAAIA